MFLARLNWSDNFSVGFPVLDAQHQEFFRVINELEEALEKKTVTYEELSNCLNELIRYMQVHIRFEEAVMHKYRYPELDAHITCHNHFRDQIMIYSKDFREKRKGLAPEIRRFMVEWLSTHILSADQRFSAFMRENHPEIPEELQKTQD